MNAYFTNAKGELIKCEIDGDFDVKSKRRYETLREQAKELGATSALMIVVK